VATKRKIAQAARTLARSKTKPPPTKEEVKAARKARSAAHKILMAHRLATWKKGRKGMRGMRARFTPAERADSTWRHDFDTMLRRAEGETPEEVVANAEAAANRMAAVVGARDPEGRRGQSFVHYRRGARHRISWIEWQERFDSLVHAMVDRTQMGAAEIVERAAAIADLAAKVIAHHGRREKARAERAKAA